MSQNVLSSHISIEENQKLIKSKILKKMKKVSVIAVVALMMASCGGGGSGASSGTSETVQGKISDEAASGKQVRVYFGTEIKSISEVENGDFTISLPVPDKKTLSIYDIMDAGITPADAKYIAAHFSIVEGDEEKPLLCFGKDRYAEFIYVDRDVDVSAKDKKTMYLSKGWNIVVFRYQSMQKKWFFERGSFAMLPFHFRFVSEKEFLAGITALTNTEGPGWFNGTFTGRLDEDTRNRVKTVKAVAHKTGMQWVTMATSQVSSDGPFTLSLSIMGSNPSTNKKGGKYPVETVTWIEVQEFIKKLNAATGKNYRLPTEAEWEYAARGGEKSEGYEYSGGNILNRVAWSATNSEYTTHPVGQKQPNELGIYDMSGNVWEWCSDWYDLYYYSASPEDNPAGPASPGVIPARVVRGGSIREAARACRVKYRSGGRPNTRDYTFGFRLVLP